MHNGDIVCVLGILFLAYTGVCMMLLLGRAEKRGAAPLSRGTTLW